MSKTLTINELRELLLTSEKQLPIVQQIEDLLTELRTSIIKNPNSSIPISPVEKLQSTFQSFYHEALNTAVDLDFVRRNIDNGTYKSDAYFEVNHHEVLVEIDGSVTKSFSPPGKGK